MQEENKTDPRLDEIAELVKDYERHIANEAAFLKQLQQLSLSLAAEDAMVQQKISGVVDNLPDASPKAIIDKLLQLPTEKRGQLVGNIEKLKIAAEVENRKASVAWTAKAEIEAELLEEKKDSMCIDVFKYFETWIDSYNSMEETFYRLTDMLHSAFSIDQKFHMRGQKLGLNPVILTAIDSYLKPGYLENAIITDVVNNMSQFSEAEGNTFFKKSSARAQDVPFKREEFFTEKFGVER